MTVLKRGEKLAYDWFKQRKMGEIHEREALMQAAGWSETSLKTYLGKNKLAPFVLPLADGKLKVLMNGADITEEYFHEVFRQTAPRKVNLSVGDRVKGTHSEYELVEPLGRGAVGHVWSAKKLASKTVELVAVKIMLPREDLLADSALVNIRERFRREGRNGPTLDHVNVVRYLDAGDVEKNPFLVMELAERAVSKELEDGPLAENDAADIVRSVLNALDYLHSKQCPHRDIKPANILQFEGATKVGDLGIVKWSDFDPAFTKGGTITKTAVQLGSWFYMAPEQQEDPHEAVPASDIYALAVTWIELLLNKVPSPQAIGQSAYPELPADPSVRAIVKEMLRYAPKDRPSIAQVKAVLGKF